MSTQPSSSKTATTPFSARHFETFPLIFLGALIVTAIFFSGVVFFLHPRYDTNDDVFATLFVSGRLLFTNHPHEYLIFTNTLVGLALKALYSVRPDSPWYSIYIFNAYFIGTLFSFLAILRKTLSPLTSLVFLLSIFAFLTEALSRPQFTVAAAVLGVGSCLLFEQAFRENDRRLSRVFWVLSVSGLVLTALVRINSLYLTLALLAPFFALRFIHLGPRKFKFAVQLVTILLICFALEKMSLAYFYLSSPWGQCLDLIQAIVKGFDFRRIPFDPSVVAKQGWTLNDVHLFYRMFYDDPKIFNVGAIEGILAQVPRSISLHEIYLSDLRHSLRDVFSDTVIGYLVFGLLFSKRRARTMILVTILLTAASLCAMYFVGRAAPWRVYFPIQLILMLISLAGVFFYQEYENGIRRQRLFVGCVAIGAAAVFLKCARGTYEAADRRVTERAAYRAWVDHLQGSRSPVLIAFGGKFSYEDYVAPFDEFRGGDRLRLMTVTHHSLRPAALATLHDRGWASSVEAIADQEHSIILADREDIESIATYYLEKWGRRISFEAIGSHEAVTVFRPLDRLKK